MEDIHSTWLASSISFEYRAHGDCGSLRSYTRANDPSADAVPTWSAVGLLGKQSRKSSLQSARSHRRSDSWQMPLNSAVNNRRTHVSSVGGMKGFGRNALGVFLLRIVSAVSPDIIIILISDLFFRTLSASSKPFICGIVLSVRSKWIGSLNLLQISSASCPSLAVNTEYPSLDSIKLTRFRTTGSSSASNMTVSFGSINIVLADRPCVHRTPSLPSSTHAP